MNEAKLTELATQKIKAIKEHSHTLSVAESCTGGWLSKIITDVSGASAVYKGGVCSYSNEIKEKLLGVKRQTLLSFGAVSEQTAEEMAQGVKAALNTDIGIAITGIAGPTPDNTLKPVGLIYVSVAYNNKTIVKQLNNTFTEDVRTKNRLSAVENALILLGDIYE